MKNYKLIFLFGLFLLGSGEYKPKPYVPKPYVPKSPTTPAPSSNQKPTDSSYKYFQEDPKPRKEKELKKYLFSLPRKDVTINNYNYQQAKFTLKGTYKKETDLTKFLERLKKSIRSENKLELKTYKTSFAGSTTNHYEVTADNLF